MEGFVMASKAKQSQIIISISFSNLLFSFLPWCKKETKKIKDNPIAPRVCPCPRA
jgi:hypothetical protein